MTRKEQVKILDDKLKANKRQYHLDRINAEISAYSSGDFPKDEYLTKIDLGYKPDAFEQAKFEYSPLGKIFTDGLAKEDKVFKRLKNIEDNLAEFDDNDNKVGIFRIIKDIKDKAIKIDNDDEAVKEIRERIKELIDDGVKVNNFDEMKKEIIKHLKNLKGQGINVRIDENQINDLVNKIFYKKKDVERLEHIYSDLRDFLKRYNSIKSISYNKKNISAKEINKSLDNLHKKKIEPKQFNKEYDKFMDETKEFRNIRNQTHTGAITSNQKDMLDHIDELSVFYNDLNLKKGKGLKILTKQQILNRLPILLTQIQAGNNSKK